MGYLKKPPKNTEKLEHLRNHGSFVSFFVSIFRGKNYLVGVITRRNNFALNFFDLKWNNFKFLGLRRLCW
jgi:hypothetical protein